MPDTIKFTEEEMKQLQDLQNAFNGLILQYGQNTIQLDALNKQKAKLDEALQELQQKEKEIADGLTKKYGPGDLDPKTGVFTPRKDTEQKVEGNVNSEIKNENIGHMTPADAEKIAQSGGPQYSESIPKYSDAMSKQENK